MQFIRYLNLYSRKKKAVAVMQPAYQTETHKKRVGDVVLTITNHTPVYHREEKAAVKKKIAQQLYEIFCKYSSVRS